MNNDIREKICDIREKIYGNMRWDKNPIYRYRLLINKKHFFVKQLYLLKYHRMMNKYQCMIPIDTELGEEVIFPHFSGIFFSSAAKIGRGCVIYQQVTIGSNTLEDSKSFGAPTTGENCVIGAGAKIIGNITIGNNVRIGANCIVAENIPDNSTVILTPPRVIIHNTARDNSFVDIKTAKTMEQWEKRN